MSQPPCCTGGSHAAYHRVRIVRRHWPGRPGSHARGGQKELKSFFQGKWTLVSRHDFTGMKTTDAEIKDTVLVVEGDMTSTARTTRTSRWRWASTRRRDVRRSCFAEPSKDRPDQVRKQGGYLNLAWKRVKSTASASKNGRRKAFARLLSLRDFSKFKFRRFWSAEISAHHGITGKSGFLRHPEKRAPRG